MIADSFGSSHPAIRRLDRVFLNKLLTDHSFACEYLKDNAFKCDALQVTMNDTNFTASIVIRKDISDSNGGLFAVKIEADLADQYELLEAASYISAMAYLVCRYCWHI